MAAQGNRFIRLRLFFDYPPPAVVGCRMCWLLVDLNACRVVADLESLIRDKFEFSRGSILSLFVEDCYLPHTESVQVVRDNDGVRVKVEHVSQVNGLSSCPGTAENCRKRRRDSEEAELVDELLPVKRKKKKKKKKKIKGSEMSMAETDCLVSSVNKNETSPNKKHMKKKTKKKKKTEEEANDHTAPKPAVINAAPKSTKKVPVSPVRKLNGLLSGSSSSCKKNKPDKDSSTFTSSKAASNPKPTPKITKPPSSSSSETNSSSDEDNAVKVSSKPKVLSPPTTTRSKCPSQPTNHAQIPPAGMVDGGMEPRNQDDDEEDIQLVIKRPHWSACNTAGYGRGHGRAKDQHWTGISPGDGSRAEGNEATRGSEFKEPSSQTDSLTNVSVVLQNGAESVPKDYSSMPLLAAPPQLGQKIAFKLLELSESYTPEISEYKEGKIVNFDPITKQIELELLHPSQAPVEPGKFDLVYENPDGSERVEYAVPRGSWVTERWESLLEPRLVI